LKYVDKKYRFVASSTMWVNPQDETY
jgi:hypothetical protein